MLEFVPFHELGEQPNVIVDGSATPSTRLTLSHWPGSPTPTQLLDDLSAQIALRAIERPSLFDGIGAVSNNHFDQDGLTSAYVLTDPDGARARRDALVDVARAGDFGTYTQRDSIRIAFALAALGDPSRSPLDPAIFDGTYDVQCGRLYTELLPQVGEMLDHPGRWRRLWEPEDAHLTESLAAIEHGTAALREEDDIDLAIVVVPDAWAERATSRFANARHDAIHPAAVNQSTERLRVAVVRGRTYRVELRYETWVMYRSRVLAPRPDLRELATRLRDADPEAGWVADGPGAITPALRNTSGDSRLSPDEFLAELRRFLASAPAAWDPYAQH